MSWACTQEVVHLLQDFGTCDGEQWVNNDSPPLENGSNIRNTLDEGNMGLV
jgi:hypothetical protein